MLTATERQYFIVKHDLRSFQALPGFIWRGFLENQKGREPRMFKNVNPGDQWVEFAYIRDEENEEACSLVCGIYRCVRRCWAGVVPRKSRTKYWSREWGKHAWMIKGRKHGYQPPFGPVSVRPIDTILGRTLTKRATVIKLKGGLKEFQAICREVKSRAFNPAAIPVLGREPENEQEVLMIVIGAHQQIGIGKILRVRTGFPDMLAVVGRKEVHFELEYDSKTFKAHFPDLSRNDAVEGVPPFGK